MDHLPSPISPAHQHIEVPYLKTDHIYDGPDTGGFLDFPKRIGWQKHPTQFERREFMLGARSKEEAAANMQQWLYFGLLTEFLGVKLDHTDFQSINNTPTQEHEMLVTTVRLPRHLEDWKTRMDNLDDKKLNAKLQELDKLIWEEKVVGEAVGQSAYADSLPLPTEVAMSILILAKTLDTAKRMVMIHHFQKIFTNAPLDQWGNSTLLIRLMADQGWCLREIHSLSFMGNAAMMYYARRMNRDNLWKHNQCSQETCIGDNVDMETYKTRHVSHDCSCQFKAAQEEQLAGAINDGGMPVMQLIQQEGTDELRFSVENFANQKYVAISHVWRDGLGNINHNSLPGCQLKRLHNLVSKILPNYRPSDAVHIWIDTICVPVSDKLAKKKAIKRLRDTYLNAEYVLVLDGELQTLSLKTNTTEILMNIRCYGWMKRLWTYEEAVLAPPDRLRIQFSDGVFHLDFDLLDRLNIEHNSKWEYLYEAIVIREVAAALFVLRAQFREDEAMEITQKMKMVWFMMRWRSTTKIGDEQLIMAHLLGLDAGEVYAAPVEDRMVKLLTLQKRWPLELLFSQAERLKTPGFRWAPTSWLNSYPSTPGRPPSSDDVFGEVTERGFLFQTSGFVLRPVENGHMSKDMILLQDAADENSWWQVKYPGGENDPNLQWENVAPRRGVSSALVMDVKKGGAQEYWGLLLDIEEEIDGVIYAAYRCKLYMKPIQRALVEDVWQCLPWIRPADEEAALKMKLWPRQQAIETFNRVDKRQLDQKWCIG